MNSPSFASLFDTSGFVPRWSCGDWSPVHGWTHIISDIAIFAAYAAIPAVITYFILRKGRVQLPRLWWLFAAFIFACGSGHLIEAVIFWEPVYRLSAAVKVTTAVVSWGTVLALFKYLPLALTMPDAVRLNAQLAEENSRHTKIAERLRARESEWQALAATVPDVIFTNDSSGACTFVNQRFLDLTGRSFEEFLGHAWLEVLHPDDRELTQHKWLQAQAGRIPFETEYRFRVTDGSFRWFLGRSSPVLLADGSVEKWVGCATDITERKHADELLLQSKERLRLVVEAAPNAMVMVDESGRIRLVNSQTEILFGYDRHELLGQPVELLVPDRLRQAHDDQRKGFMTAPHAREMGAGRELFGRRKEGTEVPIEIGLNPIQMPDGPAVLASIIDITERKRAEDALRLSLHEKETLLKEVHHRVKNNLQVITSLLQLQERQLKNPELAGPFRECQSRVRSMALIHEKLYQSGSLAFIQLDEYLPSLARVIHRSYTAAGNRIELRFAVAPLEVSVDVALPVGLLVNELMTNALKYAFPHGAGGWLEVRCERLDDGTCRLRVSDNGVGLAASFSLEAAETLGMRLVGIFARQLGGEIHRPPTDAGLCLEIRFPLATAPSPH